jgi:hypothetical protein
MNTIPSPLAPPETSKNKPLQHGEENPYIKAPSEIASSLDAKVVEVSTAGAANEILSGMEGSEVREQSEAVSEKKQDPASSQNQSSAAQQDDAAQLRADLQVAPVPVTRKVMLRKVKHALVHEMKELKKLVHKYKKNALHYARELAESFQKLRTLRNLLKNVISFTAEFLQMIFEKVQNKESLATVEYL